MLIKIYGSSKEQEKRYSPAECTGIEKRTITGNPDKKDVSTSYVERQNLTMRMSMRRFTDLRMHLARKLKITCTLSHCTTCIITLVEFIKLYV